jgi:hypothetical protein
LSSSSRKPKPGSHWTKGYDEKRGQYYLESALGRIWLTGGSLLRSRIAPGEKQEPKFDWKRGVSVGACQICGEGHDIQRDWYSGDHLCARCKRQYSAQRRAIVEDRHVPGMIEVSRAIRLASNSDRMWAIQPYRGGS